jgi:uncharacterized protein YqhQ
MSKSLYEYMRDKIKYESSDIFGIGVVLILSLIFGLMIIQSLPIIAVAIAVICLITAAGYLMGLMYYWIQYSIKGLLGKN